MRGTTRRGDLASESGVSVWPATAASCASRSASISFFSLSWRSATSASTSAAT
jgi:hypothetical protein